MSRLQWWTVWLLIPGTIAAWQQSGFAWGEWGLAVSVTLYLFWRRWGEARKNVD